MRPPPRPLRAALLAAAAAAALASVTPASAQVLYDGTLATLPAAQGWRYVYGCSPLPCGATQTLQADSVRLDTMAGNGISAGWFASFFSTFPPVNHRHPALPVLDRAAGFTVAFDLQLVAERHVSVHRAGFSIIVIAEDRKGIELGFWADEVWAQTDLPDVFEHGEGAAFDTTAARVRYELCIQGDVYTLRADGNAVLTGPVRDYHGVDQCNCCSPPIPCPYSWPSHVFLGDDTTSAAGTYDLFRVEVVPGGSPSPAIGNGLQMVKNGAAIDVQVTPARPAAQYHLYRDLAPAAIGSTSFATAPGPQFPPDLDSLAAPDTFYFTATGIGACGQEFP